MARVAINGLGRIGRATLKIILETPELELVGVNDYILADAPDGKPEVILIATGTEVNLIVQAQEKLLDQKVKARIVSMPSWELFEAQPVAYRNSVLPPKMKARLAVEAGS